MKRTALAHTKMKRLMRALDIPLYIAVGLMESLWHLTARETPRGDIGKLSNEEIAMQLDWRGDPDILIQALLVSRWLDVTEELRLVVHDWHDHADDAVDNMLARAGKTYANGQIPHMKRLPMKERTELLAQYPNSVGTASARKATESLGVGTALPLPVPLPKPEPVPKKVQKPSAVAGEKAPDSRHVPFKLACQTYAVHKQVTFAWDESEAKQLALLLKAAPSLTLQEFQACLNHRARSPGTPHGDRPRIWLPNILKYQQGPLNEFNRTEEVDANKLGNNKANNANTALARAQARAIAEAGGNGETGLMLSGPRRGDGRDTPGKLLQGPGGGVPG